MSSLPQSVPASFRNPAQTSRFAASLLTGRRSAHLSTAGAESRTPIAINSPLAVTSAAAKGRVARLPHEPEDARLTGVTRSLHRRLLALNIGGSLASHPLSVRNTRIA